MVLPGCPPYPGRVSQPERAKKTKDIGEISQKFIKFKFFCNLLETATCLFQEPRKTEVTLWFQRGSDRVAMCLPGYVM